MADDKKKAPPKKVEAPAGKGGHQILLDIIGVFFACAVLVTAFSGSSLFNIFLSPGTPSNNPEQVPGGDFTFWQKIVGKYEAGTFPPSGSLAVNSKVINERLTQVRREPGGSVIGMQKRGEESVIADGPISAYGERWWMVNYDSTPSGWVNEKDITTEYFWYYVANFFPILWDYFKVISWIVSGFFALTILYIAIKEPSIPLYDEAKEEEKIATKAKPIIPAVSLNAQSTPANLPTAQYVEQPEENTRWKHVELLMKSHNPSDWKQAIIEADVMLEDMLDKVGYPGVSIGDKLKNIEESDFETLDKAWEAHKVRNRIAHDGSGYKFPYDEAARVIGLYHDVFKEFYWV